MIGGSMLLTLGEKTPTMVGESMLLTFKPALPVLTTKFWAVDTLGSPVPREVQDGGNQINEPWYVKRRPSLRQASRSKG